MVNTPIPHSLKSEAKKAAKILREFTMPNAKAGPDKLIPAGILAKAKGLAIITVFKAGFLVSARGGSGIVIAKVDESIDFASGWSAPSAIGMAGLGGGFEIGAEVTDFVILLNSRSAVEAFSKGGNLTLGGNFTIAAGPLGRNLEADIAVRSPAAIYTYSRTKGIFAGISVEGSALIERKDANRKFYGKPIRAFQILQGEVDIPEECFALYEVMRDHQKLAAKSALQLAKKRMMQGVTKSHSEWNISSMNLFASSSSSSDASPSSSSSSSFKSQPPRKHSSTSSSPSSSTSTKRRSFSSFTSFTRQRKNSESPLSSKKTERKHSSSTTPVGKDPWAEVDADHDSDSEGLWAMADYAFQGQLSCDLSFRAGDKLLVVWHSSRQCDWWEGITKDGKQGIFPANFCHLLDT